MKYIVSLIIFISISFPSFSQSKLDKSLSEISSDIASKLSKKEKKKVVVLYVNDVNKLTTNAGKYIADVISVDIVNDTANFQVFDRENLNSIAEAKKLISEGYIDVDMAKELGKRLSVDAIIIGTYTVLSNTLKVTLKALDSNTGFVIAASMKDLLIDEDAGALLGINLSSGGAGNRGFNAPINSGENFNNPETVNKECEIKNIGDYCFENRTKGKVTVRADYNEYQMTLDVGQTQCFYNLKPGNYIYSIEDEKRWIIGTGQILVEKCKSKTFVIK